MLRGEYPEDVGEDLAPFGLGEACPEGDLALIGAPIDVLGVNCYSTAKVRRESDARRGGDEAITLGGRRGCPRKVPHGLPRTAMGWEIQADGLRGLLVRLHTSTPAPPDRHHRERGGVG